MSVIQQELIFDTINEIHKSLEYNSIHKNFNVQHEFRKKMIIANESLTKNEKSEIITLLNKNHDYYKIIYNEAEGIYSAEWVNGYETWNSKKQQLESSRSKRVILKRLRNVENANKSWFEETKSYFITSSKWNSLIRYYGLTKDQLGYMLVMEELDMNLRSYLQNRTLSWKEIIKITQDIIYALLRIHEENVIHKNLHSRNILFLKNKNQWHIGDLGFCGPADKTLDNIYGTLPYVAPEVIAGKEHTLASDIYSLAMLMWEISSGYPPFVNYEHDDYTFVIDVNDGMRPTIIPGTPLEYKELMEQCWNADPIKRPNINVIKDKINEMMNRAQQTDYNMNLTHIYSINSLIRNLKSKIYNIMDFCEPKNIIKAYPSIQVDLVDLSIPNNLVSENKIGQFDSPMLIVDDDDDEVSKPKRIYVEISDESDDDDVIIIQHKKIKVIN
ncbi:kinase-like domain-containing protein [Rhizophagus clarus]|uniref:Kinase-like domain-containing protein n=1 Tax=Rhizophagus clarus TaxID=94130 RepID=A0A8H3LEK5_9GLOM|nr:kinase-like domain-containing protein [Rhizophagus clarus]